MTRIALATTAFVLGLLVAGSLAAQDNPSALYDRAKKAIAAGSVFPERDLAPLIDVLLAPASTDDLRTAIDGEAAPMLPLPHRPGVIAR